MGSRESMIDTACKTLETGSIQWRLVKAIKVITKLYQIKIPNNAVQSYNLVLYISPVERFEINKLADIVVLDLCHFSVKP